MAQRPKPTKAKTTTKLRGKRARGICGQARLRAHSRAEARSRRSCDRRIRGAEARRAQAALRSAAGTRRRVEELGGDPGPEPHAGREAPCGAHRRPPDRISRLRGQHPERRIWRRIDDRVGPRSLASRGRPPQGAREGAPGIPARRRAAAGPLASGPHPPAGRREDRALAAHEGRRRIRPPARRTRNHR